MAEKQCVVCGLGSHRADWTSKANPACDSHTAEQVKAAIAALQPAQQVATPPPATPPVAKPPLLKI